MNALLTIGQSKMPRVVQNLRTVQDIAPYLGLAQAPEPPLDNGHFRNIIFLGWGADMEEKFLTNCEFTPWRLPQLVAYLDGQVLFKNVNPWEVKSSKLTSFGQYWLKD